MAANEASTTVATKAWSGYDYVSKSRKGTLTARPFFGRLTVDAVIVMHERRWRVNPSVGDQSRGLCPEQTWQTMSFAGFVRRPSGKSILRGDVIWWQGIRTKAR